jgi:hypothetical protein
MAKFPGDRQIIPLEDVVLAQAFQQKALLNVLERKSAVGKAKVLEETTRLRERPVGAR